MASNMTSNYKLNQWAAEDRILREEFNDNFGKIETALTSIQTTAAKVSSKADTSTLNSKIATVNSQISAVEAKIPKIVTGTYTGDGADSKTISLGFTPKAVYVCRQDGATEYASGNHLHYGGLALPNYPVKTANNNVDQPVVSIVTGGFTVYYRLYTSSSVQIRSNDSGVEFHYMALG